MTSAQLTRWQRIQMPESFLEAWRAQYGIVPPPDAYERRGLRALVGREPVAKDDERWHISMSREDRVPSWGELVSAVHELRPGVAFAVGIPPRSWWLSVHPHTLHAWEIKDPHLIAEWRSNARGDTPT